MALVTDSDNGGRCVDFCSFHRLVVGATRSLKFQLTDNVRPNEHIVISSRFKICLLNARNKRGASIGLERDQHLMLTEFRVCVPTATSRRVGELGHPSSTSTAYMTPLSLDSEWQIPSIINWRRLFLGCRLHPTGAAQNMVGCESWKRIDE